MQTSRKKSLTTKAGTELPLLDLKGKDYLQVAHRLVWLREEHPDWAIKTGIVERNDKFVVFRCEIYTADGKLMATGHKREDAAHFPDCLEKAETGAVGRAAALCGYGTQFAPDLDEEERLADSPIARPVTRPAASRPTAAIPPPGGVKPSAGKPGPAAPKTASPSKIAEPIANFDDFPGGPFNN